MLPNLACRPPSLGRYRRTGSLASTTGGDDPPPDADRYHALLNKARRLINGDSLGADELQEVFDLLSEKDAL